MRVLGCVSALVLVLAGECSAQFCAPLLVSSANTGPGCAPFGGGLPSLTGGASISPPGTCVFVFTVVAPPFLFSPAIPVLLGIGATNPALALAPSGFPGCTLLTSAEVLLVLPPAPSPPVYSTAFAIPASPALVGATAYTQAVTLPSGLPGLQPALSNGIAVSL